MGEHPQTRHGPPRKREAMHFGCYYSYSGTYHEARPYPPVLAAVRDILRRTVYHEIAEQNFVIGSLVQHYVDGSVGIGKHSDDETGLVPNAPIVTVTLIKADRPSGLPYRVFCVRRKRARAPVDPVAFEAHLGHGDVFVMGGEFQKKFKHEISPTAEESRPRVSLTFRAHLSTRGSEGDEQ